MPLIQAGLVHSPEGKAPGLRSSRRVMEGCKWEGGTGTSSAQHRGQRGTRHVPRR